MGVHKTPPCQRSRFWKVAGGGESYSTLPSFNQITPKWVTPKKGTKIKRFRKKRLSSMVKWDKKKNNKLEDLIKNIDIKL